MPISRARLIFISALVITFANACSTEQPTITNNADYKEMKTMVIDILKTDEAQKALQSTVLHGGNMQAQSLNMQQQEQLLIAVKNILVSPTYEKILTKVMQEPKFAGEFAKSISKENKQILKALMKDPEYQKDIGSIMKSPDVMKLYVDMLKTSEFRKQFMTMMKDTMNNPLFKLEVMELLKAVVKEELQPKEKQSNNEDHPKEDSKESEGA